MTARIAETARELFDSLVERHGGSGGMSPVDLEMVGIITKLLASARTAPPGEVPRIGATVARRLDQLPKPRRGPDVPNLRRYLAINGDGVPGDQINEAGA